MDSIQRLILDWPTCENKRALIEGFHIEGDLSYGAASIEELKEVIAKVNSLGIELLRIWTQDFFPAPDDLSAHMDASLIAQLNSPIARPDLISLADASKMLYHSNRERKKRGEDELVKLTKGVEQGFLTLTLSALNLAWIPTKDALYIAIENLKKSNISTEDQDFSSRKIDIINSLNGEMKISVSLRDFERLFAAIINHLDELLEISVKKSFIINHDPKWKNKKPSLSREKERTKKIHETIIDEISDVTENYYTESLYWTKNNLMTKIH